MKLIRWTKSSFCSDTACLEAALVEDFVAVRNCREPSHILLFTRRNWLAFLDDIVAGEFAMA
jgi:hypothetical protein